MDDNIDQIQTCPIDRKRSTSGLIPPPCILEGYRMSTNTIHTLSPFSADDTYILMPRDFTLFSLYQGRTLKVKMQDLRMYRDQGSTTNTGRFAFMTGNNSSAQPGSPPAACSDEEEQDNGMFVRCFYEYILTQYLGP